MLFAVLIIILLMTIIFRIEKAKDEAVQEKVSLFLYLFLYTAMIYSFIRWHNPPREIPFILNSLFLAGILWFWGQFFWVKFRFRRQLAANLKLLKKKEGPLYELVMACEILSQAKMGALVAIERRSSLGDWYDKGIRIDADLVREVLFSVFTPPGSLHDGAALIRGDQVVCAAVIVPLTQSRDFQKDLGTRHRAAFGFSEATDALCLVVSEETGCVSLADQGVLYYDVPFSKLPEVLGLALRFKLNNKACRKIGIKKILDVSSDKEGIGEKPQDAPAAS